VKGQYRRRLYRKAATALKEAEQKATSVVGVLEQSSSGALWEDLCFHSQSQELHRLHG
jgi:hypothetical protein